MQMGMILQTLNESRKVESPRNEIFYFTDDGDLSAQDMGIGSLFFEQRRWYFRSLG